MALIRIDSADNKTKDVPKPINLNIEKECEIKIWLVDPTYTQQQISSSQWCPFIEHGYQACSRNFTLGRLELACSICFGSYQSCSTYQQLVGVSRTTTLDMTIDGHTIELRPTGT